MKSYRSLNKLLRCGWAWGLLAALTACSDGSTKFNVQGAGAVEGDGAETDAGSTADASASKAKDHSGTVKCHTDGNGITACVDGDGKPVLIDENGNGIPDSEEDGDGSSTSTGTSTGSNSGTGTATGTSTGSGTGTGTGTSTGSNTGTNTGTGTSTGSNTNTSTGSNTGTNTGTNTNTGNNQFPASDQFTQGPGEPKNLDVVVVVDNSGSMAEEQANLASKLTKILDFADTANWRIATRTTDGSESGVRLVVRKDDASMNFAAKKSLLQSTIQGFGINGSGNEQGIPMAVTGLKANIPSTSTPWLRQDSMVAVLVVSDEDNCSNGLGCSAEKNEASYLLNYLSKDYSGQNIGRTLGQSAKVYGLIRRNANECLQAANVGNKYMDAINGSGGLAGKICDEDYSATLSAISADIGTTLELAFTLSHAPILSSIQITVDGMPYVGSFLVNGQTLQLSSAPAAGSNIVVTYMYQ